MNCPACRGTLLAGGDRCPACGAVVSPATEGALAPDPLSLTPPSRGKGEPLREIPGLRRKDKTWKDEVRDRVRHRKRQRGGEDLPLFREDDEAAEPAASVVAPQAATLPAASDIDPYAVTESLRGSSDEAAVDLPLRPLEAPGPAPDLGRRAYEEPRGEPAAARERLLDEEPEWPTEPEPPRSRESARPVERPARAGERFLAGALDVSLLAGVWAVVVYFSGRAARVPLAGLVPSWPYLVGFLGFVGLAYAVYFTGATGQTLGKMVVGLRVVDTAGRPPGALRAGARALLGVLGIALLFSGLATLFFDPARRALHDRLLKVRVIRA